MTPKNQRQQWQQQIELFFERQAPVDETGSVLVGEEAVGEPEIGKLQEARHRCHQVGTQGTEHPGLVEIQAAQQGQQQPQPARRQQTKGPSNPEVAGLLPVFLARAATPQRRYQATGNDKARDGEEQVHAPPELPT
ncbi:hypothetical protein D3C81_1897210 [compost metagenome]